MGTTYFASFNFAKYDLEALWIHYPAIGVSLLLNDLSSDYIPSARLVDELVADLDKDIVVGCPLVDALIELRDSLTYLCKYVGDVWLLAGWAYAPALLKLLG